MLLRKLQAREQSKHIQYGSRLINGTHTHVDYRVTSLVSLMIVFYTQPPFKGDQKQKNRNQQGDVIGHIFSFYEFPPTQKHRCTENHNHPNKNYGKLQKLSLPKFFFAIIRKTQIPQLPKPWKRILKRNWPEPTANLAMPAMREICLKSSLSTKATAWPHCQIPLKPTSVP